ncbi:MAG: ABC transporter permease [Bacteroidota bacterium]|nr:ABC transporter permease [Bacteroidota bacterium]
MISVSIGALAIGFILAPLAMGVFLSYRILRFPDITVDGSFALGAVITARMIICGVDPVTATALGMLGGAVAGLVTGLLITRFGIEKLLAGILVMIGLYSVNFWILGQGSYPYNQDITLYTYASSVAQTVFGGTAMQSVLGLSHSPVRTVVMLLSGVTAALIGWLLFWFFRTRFGLSMRAAGSNEQSVRALGANVSVRIIAALAISNALAAFSGAVWAQYYATVALDEGMGMLVVGLACVLIGEAFLRQRSFGVRLFGAVLGAAVYELIRSYIMLTGLAGNYFKLITALIVLIALLLPARIRALRQQAASAGGV